MKSLRWRERVPGWPQTAQEWFVRLRAREITAETDSQFRDWLTAEPQNECAFERQELAWQLAAELRSDEEVEALVQEAEQPRGLRARFATWLSPPSLAIGLSGVVAIVIVAGLLHFWSNVGTVYATRIGEQRTIVLPDRSQVTLNTATRLTVTYTHSIRQVSLEYGEATFSVVHNAARPFQVTAANGTNRDLGTQFNILSRNDHVEVSVLQGSVQVELRENGLAKMLKSSAVVAAGQEIDYSSDGLSPPRAADVDRIKAWHARRVAFDNVSLATAVAEFNRYSQTQLMLGDPSLAKLRVSGVFRIGETSAFTKALNVAFGVRAESRAEDILLMPGSPASSDL